MTNTKWRKFRKLPEEEKLDVFETVYANGCRNLTAIGAYFGVAPETIKHNIPVGFDKDINGNSTRARMSRRMDYARAFSEGNMRKSKCWDCANTNDDDCCWFQANPRFPDGVTFIYKKHRDKEFKGNEYEHRFIIIDCPHFKEDLQYE